MTIQLTLSKIDSLQLAGLKSALQQQLEHPPLSDLPFEERLGMLIYAECAYRESARCERLLKAAGLMVLAQPEVIAFDGTRNLDKAMVLRLLNGDWIRKSHNVLITGKSGMGKKWLSCCLGTQAARLGLSVIYRRVGRVLEEYDVARHDGSLPRLRSKFARAKLLILDDFGLTPLKPIARNGLLQTLDDRVGLSATIVAARCPSQTGVTISETRRLPMLFWIGLRPLRIASNVMDRLGVAKVSAVRWRSLPPHLSVLAVVRDGSAHYARWFVAKLAVDR